MDSRDPTAAMRAQWTVTLLGSFRLEQNGEVIERLSGKKEDLVLAFLALMPETAHRRETVAEALWPDKDTATARRYLSFSLHVLLDRLKGVGGANVIEVGGRKTLQLGRTVKTDVQEFLDLVAAARRASSPADQGELLEKALMVYRDGLLPGYQFPWVESVRIRLRRVFSNVIEALPEHLRTDSDLLELLASVSPRTQVVASQVDLPAGSPEEPEQPPITPSAAGIGSLTLLPGDRERFLAFVKEMEPYLTGPDRAIWLSRIDAEYDLLRALLQDSIERHAFTYALQLASPLWQYWLARRKVDEGRNILEQLLDAAPAGRTLTRAKALHAAGSLAFQAGDLDIARSRLEAALPIWLKIGNEEGLLKTLSNLGVVANRTADFKRARELYTQGLALARKHGDRWALIARLLNAAQTELMAGDTAQAKVLLLERLSISEQENNQWAIASSQAYLATADLSTGDFASALAGASYALGVFQELGDSQWEAFALRLLGRVAHDEQSYEEATGFYRQSLEAAKRSGIQWEIGESLKFLAETAEAMGDTDQATLLTQEAIDLLHATSDTSETQNAREATRKYELGRGTAVPSAQLADLGANET